MCTYFCNNKLDVYELIYIPFINSLYQAAEEARLPKRLRIDLGGALREFTKRESHCFAQSTEDGSAVLFTSQERQWLVLQVLQGLRAGESDVEALQGKAHVDEGQSVGESNSKLNSNTML